MGIVGDVPPVPDAGRRLDLHRGGHATTSSRRCARVLGVARDRRRRAVRDRGEPASSTAASSRRSSSRAFARRPRASGPAPSTTRACRTRSRSTRTAARRRCSTPTTSQLGMVAHYEHPLLGDMRQFGELIDFSETPGRIGGPASARRPGHARDPARARARRDAEIDALDRRRRAATNPTSTTPNASRTSRAPDVLRLLPPGAYTGIPRRALRARRPLLDRARSRSRSRACRIRAAPTGRCCTTTASATSCASRTTPPPYDPAPCTRHRRPAAGSRERRPPARSRARARARVATPRPTSSRTSNAASASRCTAWAAAAAPAPCSASRSCGSATIPTTVVEHLDRVAIGHGAGAAGPRARGRPDGRCTAGTHRRGRQGSCIRSTAFDAAAPTPKYLAPSRTRRRCRSTPRM